jgi:hypothetical protein
MSFRIPTDSPAAVLSGWTPAKRQRYAQWQRRIREMAARHGLPPRAAADALLLFQDLKEAFTWAEHDDFAPVFCTLSASPGSR